MKQQLLNTFYAGIFSISIFYTLAFTEKFGTGDKSKYGKVDAAQIRYFGILPNFWVSEKGFFLSLKERVFFG